MATVHTLSRSRREIRLIDIKTLGSRSGSSAAATTAVGSGSGAGSGIEALERDAEGLGPFLLVAGSEVRVCAGGLPFARLARGRLLWHLVDLLKGETFSLGNKKIGISKRDETEGSPDEEDFGAEITLVFVGHVGGYEGYDEVLKP